MPQIAPYPRLKHSFEEALTLDKVITIISASSFDTAQERNGRKKSRRPRDFLETECFSFIVLTPWSVSKRDEGHDAIGELRAPKRSVALLRPGRVRADYRLRGRTRTDTRRSRHNERRQDDDLEPRLRPEDRDA